MFNQVLWTLDNDFDPLRFERLCTDLMFRNGYTNIVPFGRTRDRGRDAQLSIYKGNHSHASDRVFFQYSLEKRWEGKLKKEINKIKSYDQQIASLIFITSQNVSGDKKDKLEKIFSDEYECNLMIFDREWLRLQLEEANKDLAQKYLGISGDVSLIDPREGAKPSTPSKEQLKEAYKLFDLGKYEQAIPKLKELLGTGFDVDIWKCIAWCHYILSNYVDALRAVEKSLVIEPKSRESILIKGCILAEAGISEKCRTKLALSKKIFLQLVELEQSWILYYNLGNVLNGLQEYDEAKNSYLKALDKNSAVAEIWNNLGNCLHHLEEHEKELSYFDQAIYLNPGLYQAFISKANTLGKVYGKYEEAIEILNFIIERNPDIDREFRYFWYWRSKFLLEIDEIDSALDSVKSGLINFPNEQCLLELKSYILSNLWPTESSYLNQAKAFFEMRAYSSSNDYRPFIELAEIYLASNELENSWKSIINAINILSPMQVIDVRSLKHLGFSVTDLINSIHNIVNYEEFRKTSPVNISSLFEDLDEIVSCIYQFLWISSLVSFNDLFSFFLEKVKIRLSKEDEMEVSLALLVALKISRTNVSKDIIKIADAIGFFYSDREKNLKIKIMTSLMLALPEVALVESSRQFGYLVGLYNINSIIIEKVELLVMKSLTTWVEELSVDVGQVINSHFLLLSNSADSYPAD